MARIRTIKPEFFTSEDIVELLPLARLLYIALWCESDKEGRLSWKPKTFKMRYLPQDDCDIEAVCQLLINKKLIVLYGDGLAFIPSFKSHQHINPREQDSVLPDPSSTRAPRVSDASVTVNARAGRKEGREGKEIDASIFETFWLAYPKKIAKQDAEKAFTKLNPDAELQAKILQAVGRAAKSPDWIKESGQFIPNAATWLNGKRWEDGLTLVPSPSANDWRNDPRFRGAK